MRLHGGEARAIAGRSRLRSACDRIEHLLARTELDKKDRVLLEGDPFATVEASFQLHELMEDARTSFEALQRLEAPGFEQVFRNETLRKEFESLTQKLGPTS